MSVHAKHYIYADIAVETVPTVTEGLLVSEEAEAASAIVPSCEGVPVNLPRQVERRRFCWFIVRARAPRAEKHAQTHLASARTPPVMGGKRHWCCQGSDVAGRRRVKHHTSFG